MNLILNREERLRFIQYCKQQVETSEGIIEQMEKLNKLGGEAIEQIIKKEKQTALAYSIVVQNLESYEEFSI